MKILVTGANGYIGTGVVKQLLQDGMDVIATDITEKCDIECKYLAANLFEIKDPFQYFEKPDVLLHLAWRDGFRHSSDTHIQDLSEHYLFIKKMCEAGLKRVCVMGSVHEIGFFEGAVNENTPAFPQSNYGVAKNALRGLTALIAKENKVNFQWIRGYYIVGNTHRGCSIFSKITEAAENGKETFPFTDGKNQFDFISYGEFCEQVAATVEQEEVLGIINCCSGYPERIGDRVEKFIKDSNYDIKLEYGAFPSRPYDSKAIWGDNSKICRIMNQKL